MVLRRNVVVESVEGKTIPKKQKPGITFKKKERAAKSQDLAGDES